MEATVGSSSSNPRSAQESAGAWRSFCSEFFGPPVDLRGDGADDHSIVALRHAFVDADS